MGWDNRQMDLPQYERQSDMDTYHHLTIREHEDRIVADFTKQPILDAWTAKELGDELRDVAGRADCRNLILNFSDVKWLASAVLEKLVVVHRSLASKGGSVTLVGVGPEIREILALTKLDQVFSVRSTEADTSQ